MDSRCSFHSDSAESGPRAIGAVAPPGVTSVASLLPNSTAISQSCRASPGGGTAARTREMRRSELVTVPSFSAQLVAGSNTSANSAVSVSA